MEQVPLCGRKRILFYNVLAMGHIANTLPLVRALVHAGHQVIYYCSDNFKEAILTGSGAEYRCYPNISTDVTREHEAENPVEYDVFYVTRFNPGKSGMLCLQPAAVALLPALLEEAAAWKPDLIIYDLFAVWGNYISQVLDVPCVCTMCTVIQDDDELKNMGDSCPDMRPNEVNHAAVTTLKDQYGISTEWERSVSTYCTKNLVFVTKALQPQAIDFNGRLSMDTFTFIGSLIDPAKGNFVCEGDSAFVTECQGRKSDGGYEHVVYVSMGTNVLPETRFWHLLQRAVAGKPILLVVSLGRSDPTVMANFGDQVVWAKSVPQLAILQMADAFISHAGIGSVNEALLCGVPMVCVPHFLDQFQVANQVEDVGAGVMLDSLCITLELLSESLDTVLYDPSMAAAMEAVKQQTMQSRMHTQDACEFVLESAL